MLYDGDSELDPVDLPLISEEAVPFKYDRGRVGCLLIHGFCGTPWEFRELGQWLAQRDISVTAPLLPGHGTKPDDLIGVRWEKWVDASRKEVKKLREVCTDVFILGLSMGGSIALLLSSQIVCEGVISLSAPILLRDPRIKLLPFVRPFIRYWKKPHYVVSDNYPVGSGYDQYPLAAVSELNKLLKHVRHSLSEVKCPVLIVHARGDKRVLEINAEEIVHRISSPDKRTVYLNHPTHVVTKGEDRERVQEEVARFIRSHSRCWSDEGGTRTGMYRKNSEVR